MCGGRFKPVVAVDGCVPDGFVSSIRRIVPACRVVTAKSFIHESFPLSPSLASFLRGHRMGAKLVLPLLLQKIENVLYADNDVICLDNISTELSSDLCPFFMLESAGACYDSQIVSRLEQLNMRAVAKLNGGFHWIPKCSLDSSLADNVLNGWSKAGRQSWFTEQTINASMFARANGRPFCRDRFVVTDTGQFYWDARFDLSGVYVRHYTSTVRHQLYREGYPHLIGSLRKQA